ncbi:class F sortase [Amycolatopsis rhabdoformis]|uniref:Class F sortase n=1 Tax=Amycolatopsis rhabdoformis TaxID=1448059 RepID=A0ABZ1IFE0_9PSEU|nr:class F sortase [Amycolatopsis rhabdoformis]WSE33179.1 class F sortase [Amycolatopsis rhabdoformis]
MRAELTRVCCALALVCAACAPAPSTVVPSPAAAPTTAAPTNAPPGTVGPLPATSAVSPVGLSIPAIGVAVRGLVPLALGPAHELQAPARFADVGWYAAGPAPGDPGPAVIAAHVDSRSGPAPFFRLRELRPGDEIQVERSDGAAARFVVDAVQRYPKNAFPTEAVYGPAPGAALRLITCGGAFDAAARSYRDNVVVYASTRWT